jgi:hypothetical protein
MNRGETDLDLPALAIRSAKLARITFLATCILAAIWDCRTHEGRVQVVYGRSIPERELADLGLCARQAGRAVTLARLRTRKR